MGIPLKTIFKTLSWAVQVHLIKQNHYRAAFDLDT